MPEAREIARWIAGLADPSRNERLKAARELYRAGLDLCRIPFDKWQADPEFRELLVLRHEKPAMAVGLAVTPENFERLRAASAFPALADVPPDQDAIEFELHFPAIKLDVLTTRDPGGAGAIARYLQKLGEGIQQIEIDITDVDRATGILQARFGLAPVYPATRNGADGTRVNFFLAPAGSGKVLIELVEARAPAL
jgi:hypothetical protein